MKTEPESQFNVAYKNAEFVHDLKVNIYAAKNANDFTLWYDLLEDMNSEVIGWYNQHKNTEIIEQLVEFERKAYNTKGASKTVQRNVLMNWTRAVINEAYKIWFVKIMDTMFKGAADV